MGEDDLKAIPTAQEVLNRVAVKCLSSFDVSTPDGRNGFVEYMERVHRAVIVRVQEGSLLVTVKCSSLQILDEIWEDYCSGHLNEVAQRFLITEDILKAFGPIEVKLATVIAADDYRACREYIFKHSLPGNYYCKFVIYIF